MGENLDYIKMFARLPLSLRRFARHHLTFDQAQGIIRERMTHRADNFLASLETNIYGNPASPYLWLLKRAGCQLGDVKRLVKQNGLEDALRELRAEGIYVTFEEFKGRKPITRGSETLPVTAEDFDNPNTRRLFNITTGGSTGKAVSVGVDLDQVMAGAAHEMISLHALGLLDMPTVRWTGILPSGSLRTMLRAAYMGSTADRWFVPGHLRDSKYWLKYSMATYYVLIWMRLCGIRVPMPEFVPHENAVVIARTVSEMLQAHGRCLLQTNVSNSVRVSVAAQEAGIDLRGTIFRGGSEPTTPAKIEQLTRAGITFYPTYGTVESSRLGAACAHPNSVDDVHFMKDAFALFAHPFEVPGFDVQVPAFNLTSLLPTAPKIMLNYQMDDYGVIEERHCGCEMESYGYSTHLSEIRSYGKLTGEGVTLIGTEIQNVLERILPSQFGGSPLDYQLMEQEDEQGFTRLSLIVSPRVQITDEQAVIDTLLRGLGESSSMADAARSVWQARQTIRLKRMEPVLTQRGKFMPLHISRHTAAPKN